MCGFQGTDKTIPERYSGDYGERDPPVPIPNTEVKPFSADGTWLETARESRTLPDSKKEWAPRMWGLFLLGLITFILWLSQLTCKLRNWLGLAMAAPSGRNKAMAERPGE